MHRRGTGQGMRPAPSSQRAEGAGPKVHATTEAQTPPGVAGEAALLHRALRTPGLA